MKHATNPSLGPSNTGKVYVGALGMNTSTLAGVYAVLAIPSTTSLPAFSATITFAPGSFNLNEIYLDVDVSAEGALVSYVRA